MEKAKLWAVWAVIFYFVINGIADNPQEIRKFRQQMNSFVDKGINMAKKAVS